MTKWICRQKQCPLAPCKAEMSSELRPNCCFAMIGSFSAWEREEPITDCNQLPKLTTEVFDRSDCPKQAKFAVVTEDGTAEWYGKRPVFNIYNNRWYPDCTDCCNRIIEGKYDASDYQNSLIERPSKWEADLHYNER